ncbi:hypothetical protein AALO_G00148440 [Alosa alosa]|uniref:Uncharacterized protein n=1 Tax=Alosa alosa TaxID=278164 RepID=A0AAV6GDH5_9TELE|nr:hypothetical protein AALO_G00148440 [Alosa alosa]
MIDNCSALVPGRQPLEDNAKPSDVTTSLWLETPAENPIAFNQFGTLLTQNIFIVQKNIRPLPKDFGAAFGI